MKRLFSASQDTCTYSAIYHSSLIDDFSHNQRFTTLIKDIHTGKYCVCNKTMAQRIGITPEEYIGLTVHDIGKLLDYKPAVVLNTVNSDQQIASGACSSIRYNQVMPIHDGSIYVDSIIKKPLIGNKGRIVAIFGYGRDVTSQVDLFELFKYYQRYYPIKKAIQSFLTYLTLTNMFHKMPTKRGLEVLLAMRSTANSQYVAKMLNLSPKTVDENKARLRDIVKGITLSELLIQLRVRNEYSAQDSISSVCKAY